MYILEFDWTEAFLSAVARSDRKALQVLLKSFQDQERVVAVPLHTAITKDCTYAKRHNPTWLIPEDRVQENTEFWEEWSLETNTAPPKRWFLNWVFRLDNSVMKTYESK